MGAAEHHLSTKRSGVGPHVHHVVGRRDNVVVVFHHDHRVALVSKPLKHANQLGGVFRVKANAGLVEDVGAAHKGASHAGTQGDALRFPATEGGAAPLQRQIAQTKVHQALQPGVDFPQQALGDFGVRIGQGPTAQRGECFFDGHGQELGQSHVADEHVVGVLPKPCAVAGAAQGAPAVTADHDAVLNLVALGFQGREEGVDALEMGASVPHQGLLLLGQGVPRRVDGKVRVRCAHDESVAPPSGAFPAPRGDRAVVQAFGRVGDDLVGVDAEHVAVAFARAACADRAVEVEHVWRRLREEHAVPFEAVVEFATRRGTVAARSPDLASATPFKKGRFNAVGHTSRVVLGRGGGEAVDDQPQHVGGVDVFEAHRPLVGPGAGVPLLLKHAKLVFRRPILSCMERRDEHHAVVGAVQDGVDHVGDAVFAHDLSRHWRPGFPDACVQHAQVVQHFRSGAHGAPGTSRGAALLNGHSRREAVDSVDVGLLESAEKLTGVTA